MGGFAAGEGGAAILGIAGAGGIAGAVGIGGGAIVGSGGMEGRGNEDAAGALAGACFCDPAGAPAALGGLKEITCVYGLGPLGSTGSLRIGGLGDGVENTPVAPSGADSAGLTAGGFGGTGIGGGMLVNTGAGVTGTGRGGAMYDSLGGAEGVAGASLARGSPTGGGGAADVGFRERISESLNKSVNPELDPELDGEPVGSLPATFEDGGWSGAVIGPNISVKAPTDFRGGSISWGGTGRDTGGASDGPSTWNGPRKKLVNSPSLGPSATAGLGDGVGKL